MNKNDILPLLVAGAMSVGGACWADEPQQKGKADFKVATIVVDGNDVGEHKSNKLWLGVGLKAVEGDLLDFLGSDEGVFVEDVHEGSPAGKAGILKGDLLLSIDGKELDGPGDLVDFMKSVKEGQALTLKVRRKNQEMEIQVTPAVKPKEFKMNFDWNKELGESGFQFKFDPTKMEVLRMGDPAAIFLPQGLPEGNLHLHWSTSNNGKTVEVKIVRNGDKPAEITVTKDGETKTYSEDQLDEIPEEIRGWVSSAIKPGARPIVKLKKLDGLKSDIGSHLESLMKDSTIPESAREALQQALDSVVAGADRAKAAADAFNDPNLRKQLDEIRAKVATEASAAVADAKKALIDAEKQARAAQSAKSQSKEVEELKQLVNELKKEISELRAANKKEKSDK